MSPDFLKTYNTHNIAKGVAVRKKELHLKDSEFFILMIQIELA